jgi:RNA polymerase sigma factor (sigma-70 family)
VRAAPESHTAFAGLIEFYAPALRRLCAAYAIDPADRDDLFQDICLAVLRAWPAFRGDATPRTWLYRIAHNVALTWQARARRRESREAPLDRDVQGVDAMAVRRIALQEAVARLSPADRAITLLWLEGLSAAEIESVTGVKAPTVAVRLSRIRRQLADREVNHG